MGFLLLAGHLSGLPGGPAALPGDGSGGTAGHTFPLPGDCIGSGERLVTPGDLGLIRHLCVLVSFFDTNYLHLGRPDGSRAARLHVRTPGTPGCPDVRGPLQPREPR
jgi:hypothetical protein